MYLITLIPLVLGVVSVNFVEQPSGEIQVMASLKDPHQQEGVSKSPQQQFPKCTNGHSRGISVTSNRIGKNVKLCFSVLKD